MTKKEQHEQYGVGWKRKDHSRAPPGYSAFPCAHFTAFHASFSLFIGIVAFDALPGAPMPGFAIRMHATHPGGHDHRIRTSGVPRGLPIFDIPQALQ